MTSKKTRTKSKTSTELLKEVQDQKKKYDEDIGFANIQMIDQTVKSGLVVFDQEGKRITVISSEKEEAMRKYLEAEEYREKGRRAEHFAQSTTKFETEIIGKLSASDLNRFMQVLPHIHYTNPKETEQNIIKINKKPATKAVFADLWGVDDKTVTRTISKFKKLGLFEQIKEGNKYIGYRINENFFLKGENADSAFTKKIVLEKLKLIIPEIEREVSSLLQVDGTRKESRYRSNKLYPLALLGAVMTKVHYQTFILLSNHEDKIIEDGETVTGTLQRERGRKKFTLLTDVEMWNSWNGTKTKKPNTKERNELKDCLDILIRVGVLGMWKSMNSEIYIVNPNFIFVSPNMKCDDQWKEFIKAMFKLSEISTLEE